MMYLPGDILLKVDVRSQYQSIVDTRHHMMLVIGEENHHPVVAHMCFKGKNVGHLEIEPLRRGKDLILIRASFSDELRQLMVELAYRCKKRCKYVLTPELLERQMTQTDLYRPDIELQAQSCVKRLHEHFENHPNNKPIKRASSHNFFNQKKQPLAMSCHQFVFTIIQNACRTLDYPIPQGLKIYPEFAWSDLVLLCASQDDKLTQYNLRSINDYHLEPRFLMRPTPTHQMITPAYPFISRIKAWLG